MNLEQNEIDIEEELDELDGINQSVKDNEIWDCIHEEIDREIDEPIKEERTIPKPKTNNDISDDEWESIEKSIEEDFQQKYFPPNDEGYEGEEKPFILPDSVITTEEIKEICSSCDKDDKNKKVEILECNIIETFQDKPIYTWETYEDFFPCASIQYLIEIYKKKSFAGKVFEIIMVEAAKTLVKNIQGKTTHYHVHKSNNIWIDLKDIYKRTYRNAPIKEALEIISTVLDGKLKCGFTTYGNKKKKYLVLNIGPGILAKTNKDFVQSFPEDYKLENAELIFLRQIQCGLFKNNEQTFRTKTLLQFGKVAWHYCKSTKIEIEKTLQFMKTLQENSRVEFKEIEGKDKYFVKDLKAIVKKK